MTTALERIEIRLRAGTYLPLAPLTEFSSEEDELRFVADSRQRSAMFRQDLEEAYGTNVLPTELRKKLMDMARNDRTVRMETNFDGQRANLGDVHHAYRDLAKLFLEIYGAGIMRAIDTKPGQ